MALAVSYPAHEQHPARVTAGEATDRLACSAAMHSNMYICCGVPAAIRVVDVTIGTVKHKDMMDSCTLCMILHCHQAKWRDRCDAVTLG